jgi:hypothetical protein
MGLEEKQGISQVETAASVDRGNIIKPVEVGYLPGVSAHTGRPLEIALELSKAGVPTSMRGSESGRHVFDIRTGLETVGEKVTVDSSDEYHFHPGELIRGDTTIEQMTDNIVTIARRLEKNPPPFVLADHNVPLLMAAKLAGIPTVAITNISNVGFTSEQFVSKLGPEAERLAEKYYAQLDPKLREVYRRSFENYNGELPIDDPNWFQLMETGDLTIISDNEAFVHRDLGGNFDLDSILRELVGDGEIAYVGSIQPDTIISEYVSKEATDEAVSKLIAAKAEGKKLFLAVLGVLKSKSLMMLCLR